MNAQAWQFDNTADSNAVVKVESDIYNTDSECDGQSVMDAVNTLDSMVSMYVETRKRVRKVQCKQIGCKEVSTQGKTHTVRTYESYTDAVAREDAELAAEALCNAGLSN